jgi:hypothetical protein
MIRRPVLFVHAKEKPRKGQRTKDGRGIIA